MAVRVGEFVSRHVFLPKTRHLQRNGALLFVKCFNMFAAGEYDEILGIRKGKGGFASHRELLEPPPSLSGSREWSASTAQRRRQQGGRGEHDAFRWLQGMATPEVQRRLSLRCRPAVLDGVQLTRAQMARLAQSEAPPQQHVLRAA